MKTIRGSIGLSAVSLALLAALAATPTVAQDMVITGVVDGPLSGGVPKAVEFCVLNDIPDLSLYGMGSANNGGGSDGEEFTFPAGAASAGTFLYVASEAVGFEAFFGFTPSHTSGAAAINGDDAIELFMSGGVVDVFGDINVDGTGQPWDYLDGWTYRNDGTGPDGSSFVLANWSFSGINALDGETSNGTAAVPFPIGTYSGCTPSVATPDLLLTEVVVTPTGGEFVEIFNPTVATVDLSDVYLTDATFSGGGTFYYNVVTGTNAGGGSFGDFHARFPDGATIAPGEFQTVAVAGSDAFFAEYGVDPTYELYEDGAPDAIADMREALPGSIAGQGGLTNSGEVVVLYTWDGASDLVADIDYAVWGDKDEAVDKTGVVIDGPDADGVGSAYLADTAIGSQDVVAITAHASGDSFQRVDFSEGVEIQLGGNGVTGSDETSEDLSVTWAQASATPGTAPPIAPSGWIINEIHADPAADITGDANGDGVRDSSEDEFVEIFNNTGVDVDVSGWTVADGFSVRHTFPPGTVIAEGCAALVFGGGTPTGDFGNGVVQTASGGSLGLNNGGDSVTLNDGLSDVAVAGYGSEGGNNQSLTLDPDVIGAAFVLHTTAAGSGGALFSPGTRVDGSFFAGCPAPPAPWVINEIHADPAGDITGDANGDGIRSSSDDEFIELVNNSGADVDVSGWTVADGFSVRHTFPAGSVIRNGCSALVFGGGSPTGAFGNSVVQTASGGSLGLNNGGDTITVNDGLNDVATSSYGGEGGDDQSLTLDPDVTGSLPYVKHSVATGAGGALFSPGSRIDGVQFAGCPVTAEIFEIQGGGPTSPLVDAFVISNDNVVTALAPDGFFLQTPDARSDGDVDTSDGIFVFTGGSPSVAVGDQVDVAGQVVEFFDFTEFTLGTTVSVDGPGLLPAAVVLDGTRPSPDPTAPSCAIEFECYEGMLVSIADGSVGGPNQRFASDPIAEVHIVADATRAFREPGVEFPGLGLPPIPTWDGNPEVFELDPDKLGLPNMIIPAGSTFSATGVIGYEFGGYELWPTQLTIDAAPLPSAVRPRAPLEFTVGSLNMFRFFDDVDDPPSANANGDVIRDDFVVSTTEYLRRRDKFVGHILDVLGAPDILAVQEVEKLEVLQDLAADIAAVEPSVVYTAHLIEGNDIGTIDVGFLTRDSIAVDAVTQFGYTTTLDFDGSLLNDRPPLLLEARCVAGGANIPISVVVVHGRSLSGIESPTSGDRVRAKRLAQAQFVAQLVQDQQVADSEVPLVVVGDYNAFEFTDGYVDVVGQMAGDFDPAQNLLSGPDLVDPNLTKRVLTLPAAERYSFIFGGTAQTLDHALTTVGLDPRVTGFEFGRGNADAAVDLINDATTPGNLALRSSDHDGFVLYLTKDLDGDGVVDNLDVCPQTAIPEGVPTQGLGVNRWALVDEDTVFDTVLPPGGGGGSTFTTADTAGCSCEQIIDALGLGNGHTKFGCSTGAMRHWVDIVNP